jgi:hypothetical protein
MLTEPVTTVEAFAEVAEPAALQVTAEPRFDFVGAEYGRLFERSDATAFQHPLWLDGLYRNLAPPLGAEPLVRVHEIRRAAYGAHALERLGHLADVRAGLGHGPGPPHRRDVG